MLLKEAEQYLKVLIFDIHRDKVGCKRLYKVLTKAMLDLNKLSGKLEKANVLLEEEKSKRMWSYATSSKAESQVELLSREMAKLKGKEELQPCAPVSYTHLTLPTTSRV